MDVITLETLEFPRILEQVAAGCLTAEAPAELRQQPVLTERHRLADLQAEVRPFLRLLVRSGSLPDSDFPAVAELLDECAPEGSVLDGLELKALARYLTAASGWKRFLAASDDEALKVWALRLGDHSALAGAIHRVFDSTGQVIEDAVPALVHLRGEISRTRSDIDATARGFLRDAAHKDLWQDSPPTQKDGRTVLPLKSNFKGRIGAVVHEASASGATLFVEPYELVEKNNRLAENHSAWKAELVKLYRELTAKVREHRDEIVKTVANLTRLDLLLARARWGWQCRGEFPGLSTGGTPGSDWQLLQARHPLLGAAAVPIDLVMPAGTSVLLLSGPNTGGKTVSLKTVGLLSLLHQFGLPIPCVAESRLPLWDAIYTDIGDHQSLDQALSTFSSHMHRMAGIFRGTTAASLVLLDEMASGTDPQEGGALGMSFLEHFLAVGATVLGTTHHGALKNYAFTRPRVKNAAVEFDTLSGRPTYRILPDVPGTSWALETAQRVGIPQALVDRARQILEGGETDVARVINTLREKQNEMKLRDEELAERERGFQETRRNTDLMALRLKQKEAELKETGLAEMNRFVAESRKAFERLVKEIREGTITTEKIKEVRGFLDDTAAQLAEQKTALEAETAASREPEPVTESQVPAEEWKTGQLVVVEPGQRRGTVVRSAGRGRFVVALGSITMTVETRNLRAVRQTTVPARKVEIQTSGLGSGEPAVFSLNLRGMRLQEALDKLEKQVDQALLSGLNEFAIIHGLGEGVLQKGVQDYLRSRSDVKKFFFSHPEEGGYGKTIVQL